MWDVALKGAGIALDAMNAERNRDLALSNAEKNRAQQEEFAKMGIRWKVADAKEAGIHPLFALGASTHSFAPVSVGSGTETSFARDLGSMGQDITRAVNATRTVEERGDAYTKTVKDLQVSNMTLQNELLRSQIAKLNTTSAPPFPGPLGENKKGQDRPLLQVGGAQIATDPLTSNQEDFEKRYGDDGPVSWATQAAIAWRDFQQNMSGMSFLDILRAIDRKTAINWNAVRSGK